MAGSLAPGRRRAGRRPPAIAGDQARAEANPRVPVELRGRVQLHQRLDRHVHAIRRVGFGVGGPAFFWSWPLVDPRPDVRRPELRRAVQPLPGRGLDLPVVEAPVQPDARLVHRLVLLLGRRRHGDRRRGDRAARPRRRSSGSTCAGRPVAAPGARHACRSSASSSLLVDDADQRLRRPAARDHQQHRRRRPRSSACSSSR